MAHMIMEHDQMFSSGGIRPWHGLGVIVQEAPTSEDALRIANLDWKVILEPVAVRGKEVPNVKAVTRDDTDGVLGIVSDNYKIVQNVEAFAFTDDIVSQKDLPCRYETAGSLKNGEQVWLLAQLPKTKVLDDDIENYFFFTNAHNGKGSVMTGLTNVRIVCNNTLQLATQGAVRTWSFRHMGDIEARKKEATQSIRLALGYLDAFQQTAEQLQKIRIISANKVLEDLFPINDDMSTLVRGRIEEKRDTILDLFTTKDDLQNFRGTGWGLYNAVADYVSNRDPLRSTKTFQERRFMSLLTDHATLQTAQELIQNRAA